MEDNSNNLMEEDNKEQEVGINIYLLDTNNNKIQIPVEEIDKELGTTELSDLIKNNELSIEEKNLKASDILSQYIEKRGLPSAEVIHTGLTKKQKKEILRHFTAAYLNSYHDWELRTPWQTYHFSTLGRDIVLLKKTKNRCTFAVWFMIFAYLLSWNTTLLGLVTARMIMFVLTITLFQLIIRIIEMLVEDMSQW